MPARNGAPTRRRWTNQALLLLVPVAVFTGLFANTIGVDWWLDPAVVHGVVAVAIAALTPWKAPIVQRGLGRGRTSRWTSLLLLLFVATTLISGLIHATAVMPSVGPLTIMQIHIGGAVAALLLVVFHYRTHPIRVRPVDFNRRAVLSAGALGAVATAAYAVWEGALGLAGVAGAERRFTGSHERGSFDPAAMPVTSWLDDRVQHLDSRNWTLTVGGRSLSLADLAALGVEDITAVLDCTSGWYSEQRWSGVRLDRLIETDQPSVAVRSVTGYGRRFPARDLPNLWLITHAGGAPLSPGHGFPARLVAPGRRGFWWVKWVAGIEPSPVPWWWQSPFPLT